MSAQAGRPGVAPPPPTSRRVERARIHLARLTSDPNPVWLRELRQSARLTRTPIILAVVTAMMTLLMASIGGLVSITSEPAKVGVGLHHTFFSLAFFVVLWVAPAVAANSISAERGGRTWEALLLTGLGAPAIARGKFLASLTYIALYIVMLAPVGALPFLFGGVTAVEVFTAFALLGLFAALSVAFGLSMSSAFNSPAVSIVVTLLVAVPLSLLAYLGLGVALSYGAHAVWANVPGGPPVWLPTAYARADFGLEYGAYLIAAPLLATFLPAWFLYEVTIANMASPSDDRSSGLRRFTLTAIPAATIGFVGLTVAADGHHAMSAWGLALLASLLVILVFVLAGEPLGPSRRVRVHWERAQASAMRRYLGPGLLRAASLVLVLGLAALAALTAAGMVAELGRHDPLGREHAQGLLHTGAYLGGFHVFVVGFTALARSRSKAGGTPRLLLLGALFLALVGPWIVMAIGGVVTSSQDAAIVLAAPSPTFVPFVVYDALVSPGANASVVLFASVASALGWGALGAGLFGMAALHTRRLVAEHQATLARVEAALADEDTRPGEPATDASAPAGGAPA